jgi:Flavoprotein
MPGPTALDPGRGPAFSCAIRACRAAAVLIPACPAISATVAPPGSADRTARTATPGLWSADGPMGAGRTPEGLPSLVTLIQESGWRVVVFSTPMGTRFADLDELERLTRQPVRWEYRMPGTGERTPRADAVLACPLTFNSVNKFAHGHADNFAVGLPCEMVGYRLPVVVVPRCKPQLASHSAFGASLDTLRSMGVQVLFDPGAPYESRLPSWAEVTAAPSAAATQGVTR